MKRSFSIITTCKGRLEHLQQSLPRMIRQDGAEVIVVDYSCPEGTADFVEQNFPAARVVRVEDEQGFSNWKARNRGAAVATGEMLLFCDADTLLTDQAVRVIDHALPPKSYGYFKRNSTARFNKSGLRLGTNQLRGFQAVPTEGFRRLGGYDEVLSGYAAGGDTDLEERLAFFGFKAISLGDGIIDDVVEHDNAARFTFHSEPIKLSYAAGLLYRRAKLAVLKSRKRGLPLADRQRIYAVAQRAVAEFARGGNAAKLQLNIEDLPVGMPRQLGFEQGKLKVSVTVELAMQKKIDTPPQ